MRALSVKTQTLIAVVAAAGMACLLARTPDLARWGGQDVAAYLVLTAGILLTEQFQVPLRFGTENLSFSLTEALWVGALILARPSVVTMAVASGVVIGQALRHRPLHKLVFNAAQFLVALTAAQVVVSGLRSPGALKPMTFLAIGVGMGVYAAVNAGLVALVIALATNMPYQSVLLPPLPENVLHFAANTALGLAALVIWRAAPGITPILALPLAMSFIAYKALLGRFAQPAPSPVRESVLQSV